MGHTAQCLQAPDDFLHRCGSQLHHFHNRLFQSLDSFPPCAALRSDNPEAWLPVPAACNGSAEATPRIAPSTPSHPAEKAGPYAAATWSAGAALATDPAWLPPAPGQDRVMLLNLHLVKSPVVAGIGTSR